MLGSCDQSCATEPLLPPLSPGPAGRGSRQEGSCVLLCFPAGRGHTGTHGPPGMPLTSWWPPALSWVFAKRGAWAGSISANRQVGEASGDGGDRASDTEFSI